MATADQAKRQEKHPGACRNRRRNVASYQKSSLPFSLKWYTFYTMSGFDFDSQKSALNKRKHGIDFREAQALWNDPRRLEVPARTENEPRFLMIGTIEAMHWAVVITYRGDRIRIISARRARAEEVRWYEG